MLSTKSRFVDFGARGSTVIGSIARQQQCKSAATFIVLNLWIFFYEVGWRIPTIGGFRQFPSLAGCLYVGARARTDTQHWVLQCWRESC